MTDLMDASEAEDKAFSEKLMINTMQILSDSLSLLSDALHEIDLQRRALFKSYRKSEYHLLCSDQHPVKDLLFGTELGKSVKDLTEASKVTSKIASRHKGYKRNASSSSQHARPDNKRNFTFFKPGQRLYWKAQKCVHRVQKYNPENTSQYQPRK